MRPRTVGLLALTASLLPACNAELACGPGTQKVDGYCIADTETDTGGDTEGESDSNVLSATNNSSAEGPGFEDESSGGGEPPYAACFAGSDAECRNDEECVDAFNTCADGCSEDVHCPDPPNGTAVQRCEHVGAMFTGGCLLYCGVEGLTCPTGMVCRLTELCMESDGGSTGYYGTSGGDCESPMLEICVWE